MELAERPHEATRFKSKARRSSPKFREDSMSSKKQTRSLHGNKTEQKFGLSGHYREIGIKAVAAATRKESIGSPRTRNAMAINRKGTIRKEDTMNEDSMSRIARENFDKTLETGAETVRGVQEALTSARENVRDLNVRLIDMAQANTDAAFDLARAVAEAKAPSDMVQALTTHATKQFDMLTKQASELTILSQRFANTPAEPVTRRVQ
jgi:hypothetical protein